MQIFSSSELLLRFSSTLHRAEQNRGEQIRAVESGWEERRGVKKIKKINNIKTENKQKNESKKRLKMAKKMMSITFLYKKIWICYEVTQ